MGATALAVMYLKRLLGFLTEQMKFPEVALAKDSEHHADLKENITDPNKAVCWFLVVL